MSTEIRIYCKDCCRQQPLDHERKCNKFLDQINKSIKLIQKIHSTEIKGNNIIANQFHKWSQTEHPLLSCYPKVVYLLARIRGTRDFFPEMEKMCHNNLKPSIFKENRIEQSPIAGPNYTLYDWANFANELEIEFGYVWVHGSKQKIKIQLLNPYLAMLAKTSIESLVYFREISHLYWGLEALHREPPNIDLAIDRFSEIRDGLTNPELIHVHPDPRSPQNADKNRGALLEYLYSFTEKHIILMIERQRIGSKDFIDWETFDEYFKNMFDLYQKTYKELSEISQEVKFIDYKEKVKNLIIQDCCEELD